ncbi:MAG: hypothetical protein AAGF30_08955 [Pseudomonadota bacterium]
MTDKTAYPLVLAIGARLTSPDLRQEIERRLAAQGVRLMQTEDAVIAERLLLTTSPAVILIDLDIACGIPLVLTDLAAWRHPNARLLFIGSGAVFADGAIFTHVPNGCAILPSGIDDDDLIDVVAFHAGPPPWREGASWAAGRA